jgi:hypothetical protein
VRVLEFDCIDVLSGCKIAWGTQPRVAREDGTMTNLKEHQVRMLLAKVLFQDGFSERGTVLMSEHGAATFPERIKQLLADRHLPILIRESGITGEEQAIAGMLPGRGMGNFRFKAALESLRNLIHNELGSLPGQTGMDVEHRPERLHGELRYTTDLLKAAQLLPPSSAAMLRYPMLEYHSQFLRLLMDVYRLINCRTWHDLEGWSECGFVTIDYRLAPDSEAWLSNEDYLKLPAEVRQNLAVLVRKDARYWQERKLSPQEVWNLAVRNPQPALKKLPAFIVSEMLGPDCTREEVVEGAYFVFKDSELSPSLLRYESRVTDPEGRESELANGSKWMVFCNPFDLEQLFVHDAAGRHVGIAKRDHKICKADIDTIQQHWHQVSHRNKEILTPVRKEHAQWTKEQIGLHEHNQRVITGAQAADSAKEDAVDKALMDSMQ